MPRGTNVPPLAMAYHVSCPLERADLAYAGYDIKRSGQLGLPYHAELKARVWIDPMSINGEFCHLTSPMTRQRALGRKSLNRSDRHWYRYRARKQAAVSSVNRLLTRAVAAPVFQCCGPDLGLNLPGLLLNRDDDEFRRLQRGKADNYIDYSKIDIVLGGRLGIDFDKIGVARLLALERALTEQVVHKCASGDADLRPERLIVRLKDRELQTAIETLFDEQRQPADGDVLVIVIARIIETAHRPRAPAHNTCGEDADGVDRFRVDDSVLGVGHGVFHSANAAEVGLNSRGGLPDAAVRVNSGHQSGD